MYSITSDGRVQTNGLPREDGRIYPKKFMKQRDNGRGYMTVALMKNGKYKRFYVHRLVADAFIPNPLRFKTVNHMDGNPKNNNVSNLEWMTLKDNSIHSFRILNRQPWNKGKKKDRTATCPRCKKVFNGNRTGQIYCSSECASIANIAGVNRWLKKEGMI